MRREADIGSLASEVIASVRGQQKTAGVSAPSAAKTVKTSAVIDALRKFANELRMKKAEETNDDVTVEDVAAFIRSQS